MRSLEALEVPLSMPSKLHPKTTALLIEYDLETNGCHWIPSTLSHKHHILQIALRCVQSGQTFLRYVLPPTGCAIPQASTEVHSITKDTLEQHNARCWLVVYREVVDWLKQQSAVVNGLKQQTVDDQVCFIAHNNHGFDEKVLRLECERIRRKCPETWFFFDTLPYLRHLFPDRVKLPYKRRYNLSSMYLDFFGEPLEGAHDALSDVMGMHHILQKVGAFETVDWTHSSNSPGFLYTQDPPLDALATSLYGIGAHTSRLMQRYITTPVESGSALTIRHVLAYIQSLTVLQLEQWLRSMFTHEKHVLSVLVTLLSYGRRRDKSRRETLTFSPNLLTSDTNYREVDIVRYFPFDRVTSQPFHEIFSEDSVRRLRKEGFFGVLDISTHLHYTSNLDSQDFFKRVGCTRNESFQFLMRHKHYI